jgi:hypothetical protein
MSQNIESLADEIQSAADIAVGKGEISRLDYARVCILCRKTNRPLRAKRRAEQLEEIGEELTRVVRKTPEYAATVAGVEAIDWKQVADFIKEMIPVILQLIALFS